MSVAARTRPVRLPLPGGRENATVRVHPVCTGFVAVPRGFFQRPRGPLARVRGMRRAVRRSRRTRVPVPAFVIEHPAAGVLLVDTGLHAGVATRPRRSLGWALPTVMPVEMEADWALPGRLARLGLEPADVAVVVMTHLHYDHASGIVQFPDATFVVDGDEWEAAGRGGLRQGYLQRLFDHPFDWRTLDFDAVGAQSLLTFARTIDLFGDGSVRVLSTPGHTPGHCSVLLRLSGGRELLLTADAAYSTATIRDDLVPLSCADVHLYRRSLREIRRFVERTPGLVLICGHDPEQWSELSAVYA